MVRKNVIEEPEYHGRGDKSTITYYNLIIQFDNSSDFAQSCWGPQGFPIRNVSSITNTLI